MYLARASEKDLQDFDDRQTSNVLPILLNVNAKPYARDSASFLRQTDYESIFFIFLDEPLQ